MSKFYSVVICKLIEVFAQNRYKRFDLLLWAKNDNSKCDSLTYQVNTVGITALTGRQVWVLTSHFRLTQACNIHNMEITDT